MPPRASRWLSTALILAPLILLAIVGWRALSDPTATAPARDPNWYAWRSSVIAQDSPSAVLGRWGPDGVLNGGDRIATPALGALMEQTTGMSRFTFPTVFMIGMPIIAGLALAGFAQRVEGDLGLTLATLLAGSASGFALSLVGYMDVSLWTVLAAVWFAFLPTARVAWGGRAALVACGCAIAVVVPPLVTVEILALVAVLAWRGLARLVRRRSPRPSAPGEITALLWGLGGLVVGYATVKAGPWGRSAPSELLAAIEPSVVYDQRFEEWLWQLVPAIIVPLAIAGVWWSVRSSRRRGSKLDVGRSVGLAWLVVLVLVMAVTVATDGDPIRVWQGGNPAIPLALFVGTGLWLVARWLGDRFSGSMGAFVQTTVTFVIGLVLLATMMTSSAWMDTDNQWMDQQARAQFAGAVRIIEAMPNQDYPVVFVSDWLQDPAAPAWAKTHADMSLAGVGGEIAPRTLTYFGDLEWLRQGIQPTPSEDEAYAEASRTSVEALRPRLAAADRPPLVFILEALNPGSPNATVLAGGRSGEVFFTIIPDQLGMIVRDGFAVPSDEAVRLGRNAYAATLRDLIQEPPGPLSDAGRTAGVGIVLVLLLAIPGLLASGALEMRGWVLKLCLVPGVSVVLLLISAVAVGAVTRDSPFTGGRAWTAGLLAVVLGGALGLVDRLVGAPGNTGDPAQG